MHTCEGSTWSDAVLGRSICDHLYGYDSTLFDIMMHGQGSSSSSSTGTLGWLYTRTDSPSDPGSSTTWLDAEVIAYKPRFALISLGANDGESGANWYVTPATFRKNVMTISHKLLANEIMPVWLGCFHTNHSTYRRVYTRTYQDIIREYCRGNPRVENMPDRGIPFIDVQALLDGYTDAGSGEWGRDSRDEDVFGSGTHGNTDLPKAVAQAIYAELIGRAM